MHSSVFVEMLSVLNIFHLLAKLECTFQLSGCQVIRFNIVYTIHMLEEPVPEVIYSQTSIPLP